MKPAPFDYVRPASLAEALEVLASEGDNARILAGGQSLLPMLSMRLARPAVVVDIAHIPELAGAQEKNGMLVVPAAMRQAALLVWPGLARSHPLLMAAMPWIGHAQTRARGTVCGSIAHADPSAELPLCLVALGGEVQLAARKKRRRMAARDFFLGMMTTARRDDELIEAVSFPIAAPHTGYGFREFGRRHGDFAIVAVAATADRGGIGLAVGGVNDVPATARWPRLSAADLDQALDSLAWSLDARDDLHASARLRRDLVRTLGRAAIEEALQCAG